MKLETFQNELAFMPSLLSTNLRELTKDKILIQIESKVSWGFRKLWIDRFIYLHEEIKSTRQTNTYTLLLSFLPYFCLKNINQIFFSFKPQNNSIVNKSRKSFNNFTC